MRMARGLYTRDQLMTLGLQAEELQRQLAGLRACVDLIEQRKGIVGMGPLSGFLYPLDILLAGFIVATQTIQAQEAGSPAGEPALSRIAGLDA